MKLERVERERQRLRAIWWTMDFRWNLIRSWILNTTMISNNLTELKLGFWVGIWSFSDATRKDLDYMLGCFYRNDVGCGLQDWVCLLEWRNLSLQNKNWPYLKLQPLYLNFPSTSAHCKLTLYVAQKVKPVSSMTGVCLAFDLLGPVIN